MVKAIYANLVVADLARSQQFFEAVGFSFNQQFSNDKVAALVIADNIVAMLHTAESMRRFTRKNIVNAKTSTEVLLALEVESRWEVDRLMEKVLSAGGTEQRDPENYAFLYARSFEDPDHHIWEVFWMNPEGVEQSN